jgi:hypothetical protein
MAKTTFSGPVNSAAGFMQPINYITSADGTTINIQAGESYVILATAQGGPAAAVTLVLPQVTSGTFLPGQYPADERYNGIRGQVFNQDDTLIHKLKGFGTQPVNENATGVNIATENVVQWVGNGNQSAPWLAITNTLAGNVAP